MALLPEARSWLADWWSPVVMTIVSPDVDANCVRSCGLRFVDLLRPFGRIAALNGDAGVPVRTVAEQHPFRLYKWRVRFHTSDKMSQVPADVADAYLKRLLHEQAERYATVQPPGVHSLLASGRASEPTRWFAAYRDSFIRLQAFAEHETMDHPVACLLVLPSTLEGDYASAFEDLYRKAAHPPLLKAGVMDSRFTRYYVIVHDARSATTEDLERAELALSRLATHVGSNCSLLTLGLENDPGSPLPPEYWMSDDYDIDSAREHLRFAAPFEGSLGVGNHDAHRLSSFVREMAVRSLLPSLEGRIRALNHQVSLSRKGLRNQLKSFLWRKTTSSSEADPGNLTGQSGSSSSTQSRPYGATSLALEMRQLADLALMVGDTETALSTLRLVATDFRAERAKRHYAAAQEAIGVAMALSGAPAVEAAAPIKDAFFRYSQLSVAGSGTAPTASLRAREALRSATRAALFAMHVLRLGGAANEASYVAMKSHFQEDNVRAGLLLEQAAHYLLACHPPQTRKFAFHLVLAALRYKLCDQAILARYTYRQVLDVYEGRGWSFVEEHLHDSLARYARECGELEEAAQHSAALLDSPHASRQQQAQYAAQLRDDVLACREKLGRDVPVPLPVPRVGVRTAKLRVDGQVCGTTDDDTPAVESRWKALESAVQSRPGGGGGATWLDAPGLWSSSSVSRPKACAGEPISVDVQLENPLEINLQLKRLSLRCHFAPDDAEDGADEAMLVEELDMVLHGRSKALARLSVVTHKPGNLRIDGVRWTLDGVAEGSADFSMRLPVKKRSGKAPLDAPRGGFAVKVMAASPRLDLELLDPSVSLLAGEIAQGSLILRNSGAVPLRDLRLATASPINVSLLEASDTSGRLDSSFDAASHISTFQLVGSKLEPGESIALGVVFWPSTPGRARMYLLAAYDATPDGRGLRQRCTRCARSMDVLPSVGLEVAAEPSSLFPQSSLVRVMATGKQNLGVLYLEDAQAVGSTSKFVPVDASPDELAQGTLPLGLKIEPGNKTSFHGLLVPADAPKRAVASNPDESEPRSEAALGKQTALYARFARDASGAFLWDRAASIASFRSGESTAKLSGDPTFGVLATWRFHTGVGSPDRIGYVMVSNQRPFEVPAIRARLTAPPYVTVDPDAMALTRCRLELHVFNASSEEATLVVDTGVGAEGAPSSSRAAQTWAWHRAADDTSSSFRLDPQSASALAPNGAYVWVGPTRTTVPKIGAGSAALVELEIAITSLGMLTISDYALAWTHPGGAEGSTSGPLCLLEARPSSVLVG